MRVVFDLNHSLVSGAWIPFRQTKVPVEFKFELLPYFCFYCGKLSHESKFCNEAKDMCLGFGVKYVSFGELLCATTI